MLYDLATIQATIKRELNKDISIDALKTALEAEPWVPDVDRLVAISQTLEKLENTEYYGLFEGMSASGRYIVAGRDFRYCRLLRPEELAKCY
jgi:hypothetical protein